MSKIISIFNQKGGVAKTTTATNLASALTEKSLNVLLVDMDPQANSTDGLGIDLQSLDKSVYDLLVNKETNEEKILDVVKKTSYKKLDVLPADISLSNAEISLGGILSRETILKKVLSKIKCNYDYIIIDCPPSLGLLSINSLVASDNVIVPVNPSYFSIKGISDLMNTITIVKEDLKPELDIMGVLITMYDSRKNISKDIKSKLVNAFGEKVFDTMIRINSEIEYSQDNRIPVIFYNKSCNGYADYTNLAKEVLSHG